MKRHIVCLLFSALSLTKSDRKVLKTNWNGKTGNTIFVNNKKLRSMTLPPRFRHYMSSYGQTEECCPDMKKRIVHIKRQPFCTVFTFFRLQYAGCFNKNM